MEHCSRTVEEALASRDLPDLARVGGLLDRRFEDARASFELQEAVAEVSALPDRAAGDPNPYVALLTRQAIVDACRQVADAAAAAGEVHRQEQESARAAFAAEWQRARLQLEALTVREASAAPGLLRRHWFSVVCAGALSLVLKLLALPTLAALVFLVSVPLLVLRERRLRLADSGGLPLQTLQLVRELAAPSAAHLIRSFQAAELRAITRREGETAAALLGLLENHDAGTERLERLEADLHELIRHAPEGPLDEIHPGLVRIGGRVLAQALTKPSLERPHGLLLLAPRLASAVGAADLMDAAEQMLGDIGWLQVSAALNGNSSWRGLLAKHMDVLASFTLTALQVKTGRDKKIAPDVYTIGLPDGEDDALAPWIRERFPKMQITQGFEDEGIEISWDICNIRSDQFTTHGSAVSAYEAVGGPELRLMHHPRRLVVHGEPSRRTG
jgi:hypothetical protein